MAATKQEIARWLNEAPAGTTHMAVVCDTYDWEDYPVYFEAATPEAAKERVTGYAKGENMTKLMEVYNLSMDHKAQMNEIRTFHY